MDVASRNDIFKFCSHIVVAHKTSTFGGKFALWDFMPKKTLNLYRSLKGISF